MAKPVFEPIKGGQHKQEKLTNLQCGASNTQLLLAIFLLSVTTFSFGALYFDSQHKVKVLTAEVNELTKSQVLLMVPDEQAAVMANWMANNPEFVQGFVDKARKGEATVLPIGPGAAREVVDSKTLNQQKAQHAAQPSSPVAREGYSNGYEQAIDKFAESEPDELKPSTASKVITSQIAVNDAVNQHPAQAVTVLESDDGVKVIRLPHGGVRVTTREPD
ncbi:hypothetical protein [Shewanella fidelis]|uniref:hypothetical protein n=1 Tax=Shewanella fidelis TaxID=173509 RepID=UPI000491FB3D|nr:hypothetical protein [Shewanella fidelis]